MYFNDSYFIQEKERSIDLWRQDIEWHNCPEELAWVVSSVEHAREDDEDKISDPYVSDCVHVSGSYVIASDGHRISRAIMLDPVPFDMAIYPGPVYWPHKPRKSSFFSELYEEVGALRRVANLDADGENGLAFDFGDHRGWCRSRPSDYKKDFVEKVNWVFQGREIKILEWVRDEVIELADLYSEYAFHDFCNLKNNPMTVTINPGNINFLFKTEKALYEHDLQLNTHCFVNSMSFEVDPTYFAQAIDRNPHMAILRNDIMFKDFLYFQYAEPRHDYLLECNVKELK